MTLPLQNNETPHLKLERIARGDPLLRLLMRVNAPPIIIGGGYSLVINCFRLLAAWRMGHLLSNTTTTGFFHDPSMYINLVLGTVVMAYYLWMPKGVDSTFRGLFSSGTIRPEIEKNDVEKTNQTSFFSKMEKSFGMVWWSVLALSGACVGIFHFLFPGYLARMETQDTQSMADPFNLSLSTTWALIGFYAIAHIILRIALSIFWIHRLFTHFDIDVRPLHPDNAGGLSPLGRFLLSLSYIITFLGLMLVLIPMSRHYLASGIFRFEWINDVIVGMIIYLIAAPLAFFAPLSVAHGVMKQAKSQLLLQISRSFEREYAKIHYAIKGDVSDLEGNMKILKELQTLNAMTRKFPVWPFNVENIAHFSTSFLSPFLVALISNVLGKAVPS